MSSIFHTTTLVCGHTFILIVILAPRHTRTSKKQGNGEADGGGQVSHMKSLAESGNGSNTLLGALWASRSVGGSMLDVQAFARHSLLHMTQR
jgi:hypothetical protein